MKTPQHEQARKEKFYMTVKKNKVINRMNMTDLIEVFTPDKHEDNVLKAVFKGNPHKVLTLKFETFCAKQKWEATLKEYLENYKVNCPDRVVFKSPGNNRVTIPEFFNLNQDTRSKEALEGIRSPRNPVCIREISNSACKLNKSDSYEEEEKVESQTKKTKITDIPAEGSSPKSYLNNIYMKGKSSTAIPECSTKSIIKSVRQLA